MSKQPVTLRRIVLVLSLSVLFSLLGVSTAWATQVPDDLDHRLTEVSRVEEIIRAGVVGDSKGRVINQRTVQSLSDVNEAELSAITSELNAPLATCYWAQPEYKAYNGFGNLATWSWYYIEWCVSGGVITSVPTFTCDGLGAQLWDYRGCTKSRGSTGFSTMKVSGTWTFRMGCCGVYTYRTHKVDATHRANGSYSGTWWIVQ